MKNILLSATISSLILFISSCNNCYECTKKCGTCEKNGLIVGGCEGDSILNGYSIESWKAVLEAQGYSCSYNNDVMDDICGTDNKTYMEANNYDCLKK